MRPTLLVLLLALVGCAPLPGTPPPSDPVSRPSAALSLLWDGLPVDCATEPVLRAGESARVVISGAAPTEIEARLDGDATVVPDSGELVFEMPATSIRTLEVRAGDRSCRVRFRREEEIERAHDALAALAAESPTVAWSPRSGAASVVIATLATPAEDASAVSTQIAALFGGAPDTLVPIATRTSETGTSLVLEQRIEGLRVHGGELHVTVDATGARFVAQGAMLGPPATAAHVLGDEDARAIAGAADAEVERVLYDEVLLTGRGVPGTRRGLLVRSDAADVLVDDERAAVVESYAVLDHVDSIEVHELLDYDQLPYSNPTWSGMQLVLSGSLGAPASVATGATVDPAHHALYEQATAISRYYDRQGFGGWPAFRGVGGSAPTSMHGAGVTRWALLYPGESITDERGSFYWQARSIIAINVERGTLDIACHEFAHSVDAVLGRSTGNRVVREAVADLAAIYCSPSVEPGNDPWALGLDDCPQRSYAYPSRFGGPSLLDPSRCAARTDAVAHYRDFDASSSSYHSYTFIITHAFYRAVEGYGASLTDYEEVAYDSLALGTSMSSLPAFRDWAIGAAEARSGSAAACSLALGFRDTGLDGAGGPADLVCDETTCPVCGAGTPQPRARVGEDVGGTPAPPSTCAAGSPGTCSGDVLGRTICDGSRGYVACDVPADVGAGIFAGECLCDDGRWICLCEGGGMSASCDPDPAECRWLDVEGSTEPSVSRRVRACHVAPGEAAGGWIWLVVGLAALIAARQRRR